MSNLPLPGWFYHIFGSDRISRSYNVCLSVRSVLTNLSKALKFHLLVCRSTLVAYVVGKLEPKTLRVVRLVSMSWRLCLKMYF